jgi:hypothetical protein
VKVFDPSTETPLANSYMDGKVSFGKRLDTCQIYPLHTGKPMACISCTSLKRPLTTTPAARTYFALAAIKPPKQAEGSPGGWWMYITLLASFASAKCCSGLGLILSCASTILDVVSPTVRQVGIGG